MPYRELFTWAPLLAMVAIAAVQDLYLHRIRNWLTLSLLVSGLAWSFSSQAPLTPAQSFLGFLAGLAIPLIIFAVGGMGGGDVKLMAGIGAWVGPMPVLIIFLLAAALSAMAGLAAALAQRRVPALLRGTGAAFVSLLQIRRVAAARAGQAGRLYEQPKGSVLPFAVPVLIGTALTLLTPIPSLLTGRLV